MRNLAAFFVAAMFLSAASQTASAANSPPVANADRLTAQYGKSGSVNVLANDSDPDGDTLYVSGNTQGRNGSVSRSGGTVTYKPHSGFAGSDAFSYTVKDGKGGKTTGKVAVTVNRPPIARADSVATQSGKAGSVNVLTNDSDPDGNTLSVSGITQASSGSVSRSGGTVTYMPKSGFAGSDAFTYTVKDGKVSREEFFFNMG